MRTWYLAVFQKKLRTKLFIFTLKKNHFILFYLVLALESISGVKSRLFGQKQFRPKKIYYYPFLLAFKVALGAQEAPQKKLELSLIGKAKIVQGFLKVEVPFKFQRLLKVF
jgi:hypothetical protein